MTICETGKMAGELSGRYYRNAGVAECNVNSNEAKDSSTATVKGLKILSA